MKTITWLFVMLLCSSALAKDKVQDIRYTRGLLSKISCTYIGRTPTGPTLGTVDFPADPTRTVCDPLSNNSSETPLNGLLAKLILHTDQMATPVSGVMDYYNQGNKIDKDIYFADVNVPTHVFTEGFKTQSGDVLVDGNGNKLVENFALEYNSILKLGATDQEGDYEIASLSDDGARLFVKENDVWSELVNNDGNHSTRMGCPYRTLHLSKTSEVPVKLLYFQGSRYHMANVLMWKRHKKPRTWKQPAGHSLCGLTGENIFYRDSSDKQTLAMRYLQKHGWSVIANANYKMPEEKRNPCVDESLKITDVASKDVTETSATVIWTTNIPASSQLKISNFFTGEVITTPLNSDMVTSHEVKIDGLVHGLYYVIQAISVDAKGNSVISASITITP